VSTILTSCFNGTLAFADNSVTQTNNIDVSVGDESKKAFTYGIDSDSRITKYGEVGEITQINVKVTGETTFHITQIILKSKSGYLKIMQRLIHWMEKVMF